MQQMVTGAARDEAIAHGRGIAIFAVGFLLGAFASAFLVLEMVTTYSVCP